MTPIIVHSSTTPSPPRNCVILQDGRRYCEEPESNVSVSHVFGIGLFVFCFLLIWLVSGTWWVANGSWLNAVWRAAIAFFLPMLIAGIILVLQ